MATKIEIANRALLSIGARAQVSTINPSDNSVEGDVISVLWTPTFEQLARSAHWNCLTKQITLGMLQAAQGTPENPTGSLFPSPPVPWLYAYALPADCLAFRYILPSFPNSVGVSTPLTTINNGSTVALPQGGMIKFAVSTISDNNNNPIPVILTNQDQAIGVYTANYPNPSLWDSLFQAAMVASLAAYLVPALSLSMPLMQLSIATAERIITQARVADGREGVTVMDHLPDWMVARAGGYGFGSGYNMPGPYYTDMAWPIF
jgi:hypothetical protein